MEPKKRCFFKKGSKFIFFRENEKVTGTGKSQIHSLQNAPPLENTKSADLEVAKTRSKSDDFSLSRIQEQLLVHRFFDATEKHREPRETLKTARSRKTANHSLQQSLRFGRNFARFRRVPEVAGNAWISRNCVGNSMIMDGLVTEHQVMTEIPRQPPSRKARVLRLPRYSQLPPCASAVTLRQRCRRRRPRVRSLEGPRRPRWTRWAPPAPRAAPGNPIRGGRGRPWVWSPVWP